MKILILNGANLNLLGKREPEIYGKSSFEDYLRGLSAKFPEIEFAYFQSNVEGEIINELQSAITEFDGVVLNAGGYTHTSVSIADTVKTATEMGTPVVEVHISNILSREEFRHTSLIAPYASGSIFGFGLLGYQLAVCALIEKGEKNK